MMNMNHEQTALYYRLSRGLVLIQPPLEGVSVNDSDLRPGDIIEHGMDAGRGNLLGVQPFMRAADYASDEAFSAKLGQYLDRAAQRGWLSERTIVVWPEYLGTWLAVAGEGQAVYQAHSLNGAMRALALRHAWHFARGLVSAREKDRVAASLFRLKGADMARRYQAVFSALARRYSVTMVAGSILLPSPQVRDGQVIAGDGPLYNVSAVFAPDGMAHAGLVHKVVPTTTELPFVAPAPIAELPIFDTPAGRLGVLVCADSWYPGPYERLKTQGVELIAVPSFITAAGLWDKPWGGYDGAAAPADVDLGDVGRITEGQAWRKYALAGRIMSSGARHGINTFLRGALWDLAADSGQALAVSGDQVTEAGGVGAAILNLWL